MGASCDEPCTNGSQVPMDSGNCVCDPCFTGKGTVSDTKDECFFLLYHYMVISYLHTFLRKITN